MEKITVMGVGAPLPSMRLLVMRYEYRGDDGEAYPPLAVASPRKHGRDRAGGGAHLRVRWQIRSFRNEPQTGSHSHVFPGLPMIPDGQISESVCISANFWQAQPFLIAFLSL